MQSKHFSHLVANRKSRFASGRYLYEVDRWMDRGMVQASNLMFALKWNLLLEATSPS